MIVDDVQEVFEEVGLEDGIGGVVCFEQRSEEAGDLFCFGR